jgi:hypothetical protein
MNIKKPNIIFDIKKDLKWSEEVKKFINKTNFLILQEDQFLIKSKTYPNLQNWRSVGRAFFEKFGNSNKNKTVLRER